MSLFFLKYKRIISPFLEDEFDFKKILIITLTLLFVFVPFIWGGGMFPAGDDSKLYYYFPHEYGRNYQSNIISDNSIGSLGIYYPQSHLRLFVVILDALHWLFYNLGLHINLERLFLGLNLAAGFLFFYLLIKLLIKESTNSDFCSGLAGALMYTLSPLAFYSLWENSLFSVYTVSFIPIVLFFLFSSILKNNITYIIGLAFFIAFFNFTLINVPWVLAFIIVLTPLLFYFWWNYKKKFSFSLFLIVLLYICFNSFWLFHF